MLALLYLAQKFTAFPLNMATKNVSLHSYLPTQVVDLDGVIPSNVSINEKFEIFYNGARLFLRITNIRGTFYFNGKFGLLYLFFMKKEESYDNLWDVFDLPVIGRSSKEIIISGNIFPNGGLLGINEIVIRVDSFVKSGKYYYPQITLASCNYDDRFDWDY